MKLFAFGLLLLNLIASLQARNVASVGDIRAEEQEDGKFLCGTIECPPNTSRCYVSNSNRENPSVLKLVSICYSKDNKVLKQDEKTSPAGPNSTIDQVIELPRSGDSSVLAVSNTNGGDFNEAELNKLWGDWQSNFEEEDAENQDNFENPSSEEESEFADMFY